MISKGKSWGPDAGPRKLLLLVEDEEEDRNKLATVLAGAGFEIVIATNFEDGLARGCERNYAGAILDLNLSNSFKKEGVDLIARLRGAGAEYPMIALTHDSSSATEMAAWGAGANWHEVKWPSLDCLVERILRIIGDGPVGSGDSRTCPDEGCSGRSVNSATKAATPP